MPFVEDVVEHQHHASGQRFARESLPLDAPAAQRVAVTRQVQIIQSERKPEQRQQLAGEHHGAVHHRRR